MQNSMEKVIKKTRSRSIIGQIILFILSLLASSVLLVLMTILLTSVAISSRYSDCYFQTKSSIERIKADKEAGKSFDSILKAIQLEEKRPLSISITDSNKKTLAYYGEEINYETADIFNYDAEPIVNVELYSKSTDIEKVDNEITLYLHNLLYDFYNAEKGQDRAVEIDKVMQKEVTSHDFWVKVPIDDNYTAYIKNELIITGKDCLIGMIMVALFGLTFICGCIASLVRAIGNIVSQRYYLSLLLSDPITGGNNEFAFEQYAYKNITRFCYKKEGFAIIDLSLEKYQNYCTLYGVEEGEKLLKQIEKSLHGNLHSGETISRVTGGNYLILLRTSKEISDEKALSGKARYMIENLSDKLAVMNKEKDGLQGLNNIHMKAGFYYIPPVIDDETRSRRDKKTLNIKSLCIKAGIAKSAIVEDSGFMVYNHDMWEKEIWERKVEDMMEDALKNEEFQVYIQPKYNPVTEELMGGEALVRWISPTEGFISPGQFIPIFERTGFVTKLDDYMISHTAKLQADWLAEGKKIVPISVNVSRAHFAQPDLAEHIRDMVAEYPLPNKYIEIELTESAFFDDKNALLTTVNRLQEYGFEVSMDDFGSGYSSLNSLKDLPLNVLKLDAEFFRGDDFDTRGEIVVSEAIALAKKLDMRIVAEGVEKKEQVDFLARTQCDMIQGYYYAKPMPANEYEERMSTD